MGELLKGVFSTFASRWQQVTFIWGVEGGDRRSLEESKGGRGADTSSCGAIALQRKCDTLPVDSLRTRAVSGHIVTDGQHQMKMSSTYRFYIPAASPSPCRLYFPFYTTIYQVIVLADCTRLDAFPCTYALSPRGAETSLTAVTVIHWG